MTTWCEVWWLLLLLVFRTKLKTTAGFLRPHDDDIVYHHATLFHPCINESMTIFCNVGKNWDWQFYHIFVSNSRGSSVVVRKTGFVSMTWFWYKAINVAMRDWKCRAKTSSISEREREKKSPRQFDDIIFFWKKEEWDKKIFLKNMRQKSRIFYWKMQLFMICWWIYRHVS